MTKEARPYRIESKYAADWGGKTTSVLSTHATIANATAKAHRLMSQQPDLILWITRHGDIISRLPHGAESRTS